MSEPLYRLSFDAAELLRDHPPQLRHRNKIALFELAYPPGAKPSGRIEVTRWPAAVSERLPLPETLTADVQPNFYDYRPVTGAGAPTVEWHVNFADPFLFAAYGSGLFAQDEMQVAEHPLLGSITEALLARGLPPRTRESAGPTPVLLRNVERRIEVATDPDAPAGRPAGLYGNRFGAAPVDVVRRASRRVEPTTFSNIIAMAAPSGGYGEYSKADIRYVLTTAITAFTAAVNESSQAAGGAGARTIVHSGFWGCGAFGGHRRLMIALQALAARAAGIDRLVLHAGDAAGAEEVRRGLDVAEAGASRCGPSCPLERLVEWCEALGYRWGVSDGN
jgi:hypothetical protein